MSNKHRCNWDKHLLSELCTIVSGGTPSRTNQSNFSGDIPWAKIEDLTSAGMWISSTSEKISSSALENSAAKLFPKNTVLLAIYGSIGTTAIAEIPIATNQAIVGCQCGDKLIPEYLWFWFQYHKSRLVAQKQTGSQPNLNVGMVKNFQIPLPAFEIQRVITDILLSVQDAIHTTEKVIAQTRQLKRALLQQLLTQGLPGHHTRFKPSPLGQIPEDWEVDSLENLSSLITSGSRGWAQFYSDNGSLFLRSQNIRNGYLDLADKQYVAVPSSAEGSRTLVDDNDLLVTITGNNVGNVAKVPEKFETAYVNQHIALIRLKNPCFTDLFMSFFSPFGPGNEQILKAQYGQSKPGLNLDNIRKLLVPVPPLEEAKKIMLLIKAITNYEQKCENSVCQHEILKTALMQGLLTGRIPVTPNQPVGAV